LLQALSVSGASHEVVTEKLLFWGKENFGQNSKLDSFLKILRAQGFLGRALSNAGWQASD
ncbi:MAG TPA: hypothetical protein VLU73_02560, partial [Methylococcaceae bacterium]|nr:hypothetical protein [Methylococcaceae bacterium]